MNIYILLVFVIGYAAIALEHTIKVNKTAVALLTGIGCWILLALAPAEEVATVNIAFKNFLLETTKGTIAESYYHFIGHELAHFISQISAILFFLIGAMTIVELIDAHHGFSFITNRINVSSTRSLLWIICVLAFFLSAVLDNLTTTIVMISLVRKIIPERKTRLLFAGMIVIAANAGGAWSPIGDVTTTMLWIGGQITTGATIQSLLIPSMVCLLLPLLIVHFQISGGNRISVKDLRQPTTTSGTIMLFTGVGVLLSVPLVKTITHLPPYMPMLFGLGFVWLLSEFINPEADVAKRNHYSVAGALSRIDISSVLFFLGILLAVAALEVNQMLPNLANWLRDTLKDDRLIVTIIGFASAVVDNVPLVAASMSMYSIETYPVDSMLWQYLAYCAGTGGSMLIIGSAAGVAAMGMENIPFGWYLKRIGWLAMVGYLCGAVVYLISL
jgi:Na+/H+ antiporter NhaD/arsenite permease-like protein